MVYAFANIIATAPEKLAAYRDVAGEALARHQGRVVAATPNLTTLEGEGPTTGIGALLEFTDAENAHGWINDPDLGEIHALRNSAGQSNITLLG
ncbi:MAG: DUF1330 domain-containing protein [Paracoccaceae bacterium]